MLNKIITEKNVLSKCSEIHIYFEDFDIYKSIAGEKPNDKDTLLWVKTESRKRKYEYISLDWDENKIISFFNFIDFAKNDIENENRYIQNVLNVFGFNCDIVVNAYFESREFIIILKNGLNICISDCPKSISIFNFDDKETKNNPEHNKKNNYLKNGIPKIQKYPQYKCI